MLFKSDSDKWLVINALRFAAEQYAENAKDTAECPRTSEQLRRQSKDADRIADEIEQSEEA
jgi:hypothetical protein